MATTIIYALNRAEAEMYFRKAHSGRAFTITHVEEPSKEATSCKVDDYPVKGARKWVTKYYIYAYDYKEPRHDGTMKYVGMKKVGEADSKTEAVTTTRALTLKNQSRHTIRLVKVLEDGDNTVTDIEPRTTGTSSTVYTFSYAEE